MKTPSLAQIIRGTMRELKEHFSDVDATNKIERQVAVQKARKIAMDHLNEDPDYYTKLEKCGITENPPSVYRKFHSSEPDAVDELSSVWIPGPMVKIGTGVDIGYGVDGLPTTKDGLYIHDFGSGVSIYRRARPGERPDRTFKSFPRDLTVLGFNIGFTYEDATGKHEVKGSKQKQLAVTPNGKILVVVGKSGVEYLATGGKMRVTDWIYD